MSNREIIMAAASGSETSGIYWISRLYSSSTETGVGVFVDSANNVYCSGTYNSIAYIVKYNEIATVQWNKALSRLGTSTSGSFSSVKVNSSGDVFISSVLPYSDGTSIPCIVKYNSSGTLQWQRKIITGSSFQNISILIDSSSNSYIAGYYTGSTNTKIAKYNSSGTIQWQKNISGISCFAMAIDSASNLYITGVSGSPILPTIVKLNSSGVIQWQKTISGLASNSYGYSIAVDSSDNVYIGIVNKAAILKYNSSGTFQWYAALTIGTSERVASISFDSDNNVYWCGSGTAAVKPIVKYNSSGTLQWQRSISGGSPTLNRIYVKSTNMYIAGSCNLGAGALQDIVVFNLPNTGTKTGTYGSFTYSSTSYSAATYSISDAPSSLTIADSTDAESANTSSVSTPTLTNEVTTIS